MLQLNEALRALRADAGHVRPPFARLLAAFGAVLLACPIHATAAQGGPFVPFPLERASFLGSLAFNFLDPPPIEVIANGEHRLVSPTMGRLFLRSELFPSPYIQTGAVVANGFFGRVVATLHYQVMVVGPDASLPIRIDIGGMAGGMVPGDPASGNFVSLKAAWSFASPTEFREGGIVVPSVHLNFFDSFHENIPLTVRTNQALNLTLFADLAARGGITTDGVEVAGQGFAYIDPVFSFGPGVGPEYSFVFSEGVGNSAVSFAPEPSAPGGLTGA
jgi:hypothetical protein